MKPDETGLALHGVTCCYGAVTAIADVSLAVPQGEFLTLLGPSGAGKTTLLMAIAGFVRPSRGSVRLDGRDITAVAAERRNFGTVFQSYALFPHLSVAENLRYPLRVRRIRGTEAAERVRQALDLVQLAPLADRRPAQLSGGEQQRVALARALVFAPDILLLDEPLAALDRALRTELQEELRALHRRVGQTFISVTHDRDEALSVSDRIAILRGGRLMQAGTPHQLYESPRTRFVAGFLGRTNFLQGRVRELRPGGFVCAVEGVRVVQAASPEVARPPLGSPVLLQLRPEKIGLLAPETRADNAVEGVIEEVRFLGGSYDILARTPIGPLGVQVPSWRAGFTPAPGQPVRLGWAADAGTPVLDD